METKELGKGIDEMLKSMGFKKKKSFWVRNYDCEVFEKVVFQKSLYGCSYYYHYYYLIKGLYERFENHRIEVEVGLLKNEYQELLNLMDLDNNCDKHQIPINDTERLSRIYKLLKKSLVEHNRAILTEERLMDLILDETTFVLYSKEVYTYLTEKHPCYRNMEWNTFLSERNLLPV